MYVTTSSHVPCRRRLHNDAFKYCKRYIAGHRCEHCCKGSLRRTLPAGCDVCHRSLTADASLGSFRRYVPLLHLIFKQASLLFLCTHVVEVVTKCTIIHTFLVRWSAVTLSDVHVWVTSYDQEVMDYTYVRVIPDSVEALYNQLEIQEINNHPVLLEVIGEPFTWDNCFMFKLHPGHVSILSTRNSRHL